MSSINRLYKKNNKTIQKCVNLEDKLYEKIKLITENDYDATVSDIINVCIEDYIAKDKPTYYEKPKGADVVYRSVMIRKDNISNLMKFHKQTGITFTRLLNAAIKEFLEQYK